MAFKWWVYFKYVWTYILFFVWLNYDSWIPCFFAQMVIIHSCVKIVHGLYMLDCRSARHTQKMNLPTNQKGYDNSETTAGKLSTRRIQIFWVYFSVIFFRTLIKKKWKYGLNKNIPGRFGSALSNTRLLKSQTLLRRLGWLTNYLVS